MVKSSIKILSSPLPSLPPLWWHFLPINQDRKALHMASTINKQAIQSVLLWCNRYQVDPEPEHISSSCYVFKGKDRDAGLEDVKVAIKLMRSKEQFLREMRVNNTYPLYVLYT